MVSCYLRDIVRFPKEKNAFFNGYNYVKGFLYGAVPPFQHIQVVRECPCTWIQLMQNVSLLPAYYASIPCSGVCAGAAHSNALFPKNTATVFNPTCPHKSFCFVVDYHHFLLSRFTVYAWLRSTWLLG